MKKPPQGSQRDLCQLLQVLNSFPSAAAGAAGIHGSAPGLVPPSPREEGPRELRSFCLHQNPAPRLGAEPEPPRIPAGKMLSAKPPPGVRCRVPPWGDQRGARDGARPILGGKPQDLEALLGKRITGAKGTSQIHPRPPAQLRVPAFPDPKPPRRAEVGREIIIPAEKKEATGRAQTAFTYP